MKEQESQFKHRRALPSNVAALLQFPWSWITCESSHRHQRALSSNKKLTVQPKLFLTFIATWFMANPQISRWLQASEGCATLGLWFAVYCDRLLFQCEVYMVIFTAASQQNRVIALNGQRCGGTFPESFAVPAAMALLWERGSLWGSDA